MCDKRKQECVKVDDAGPAGQSDGNSESRRSFQGGKLHLTKDEEVMSA